MKLMKYFGTTLGITEDMRRLKMKEKADCMGAVTHGGCNALCTSDNIPCMLCRGPTEKLNVAAEIKMFKKFGVDVKEIHDRLNMFKNIEV